MNKRRILGVLLIMAVAAVAGASVNEEQKIMLLIDSIKNTPENTKFIRNGRAYNALAAANHLQTKYNRAKDKVKTARDFIEYLATKSSVSGKEYQIQFPDGRVILSKVFFTDELIKIEAAESTK